MNSRVKIGSAVRLHWNAEVELSFLLLDKLDSRLIVSLFYTTAFYTTALPYANR